jgi:hypothetical protein
MSGGRGLGPFCVPQANEAKASLAGNITYKVLRATREKGKCSFQISGTDIRYHRLRLSSAQSMPLNLAGLNARRLLHQDSRTRCDPAMASPAEALRVYHAPSTIAIVVSAAIIAALGGYFVGQATSLGLFGQARSKHRTTTVKSHLPPKDEDAEGSESGEEDPHDLATSNEECKLVLVVRTDLGMTKGTYTVHTCAGHCR